MDYPTEEENLSDKVKRGVNDLLNILQSARDAASETLGSDPEEDLSRAESFFADAGIKFYDVIQLHESAEKHEKETAENNKRSAEIRAELEQMKEEYAKKIAEVNENLTKSVADAATLMAGMQNLNLSSVQPTPAPQRPRLTIGTGSRPGLNQGSSDFFARLERNDSNRNVMEQVISPRASTFPMGSTFDDIDFTGIMGQEEQPEALNPPTKRRRVLPPTFNTNQDVQDTQSESSRTPASTRAGPRTGLFDVDETLGSIQLPFDDDDADYATFCSAFRRSMSSKDQSDQDKILEGLARAGPKGCVIGKITNTKANSNPFTAAKSCNRKVSHVCCYLEELEPTVFDEDTGIEQKYMLKVRR